ncbi:MAG: P-loop NTPase fold protein [Thermodesulfobacteriota bacterium]
MTWWDIKKEEIFKESLTNGKSLFVVDEPSDNDQFGFDHYVNSLEAIARECKTPFVVGVLGKWGVGKTTLINKFLRKRLKEQENIGFVYFDAWKYQKNAFYRLFLKKMKEDLSINDDTLFVRLYKTIKKARQLDELEWNKEEIKNLFIEFAAWYVILLMLAFQFEWSIGTTWQFVLPLIPSVILGLIHYGTKLIRIRKQEEEDKPLFSNEQFEEVFEAYVKKALSDRPDGKIVVVIDNLDRCTNEVALELLGTIKTFLNIPGCVYVVPVDEEAIINHLKEGLLQNELCKVDRDKQSREFLKKFFQATIRLTPFIRGDLEKYIDDISNEIAIPYSTPTEKENVASMVLTAYSHTPRKIKQFYNNLSASYLLALAQEEQGNINKGLVTDNVSFLAKLIILQEEWPIFFGYIKKDPELLSQTEAHIRGKELNSTYVEGVKQQLKQHSDLSDFLQSSRPYHSQDLEQFINLKREGYGGFADGASELSVSLLTGKAELIAEALNKGDNEENKNIIKLIRNKLSEKQRQGKSAIVFNILSVVDEVFNDIPDSQKKGVADLFTTYLAHNTQLTNVQEFDPGGLLNILSKISTQQKDNRRIVINEHVNKVDENLEEVFEYLNSGYGKHVAIIPTVAKKKLSEALEKAYNSTGEKKDTPDLYVSDVLDSLSKIAEYNNALNEYLSPGLIDVLIEKIKSISHDSITELQRENL